MRQRTSQQEEPKAVHPVLVGLHRPYLQGLYDQGLTANIARYCELLGACEERTIDAAAVIAALAEDHA